MLATVRRLVGADRAKLGSQEVAPLDLEALQRPIEKARQRLDVANAEHTNARARVDAATTEIDKAQAAFDADGSEANADRLIDLARERDRARLFSERTQRAAVSLQGDLAAAEQARNAAIVAHTKSRIDTATSRLIELYRSRGFAIVRELAAFVADTEAVIADAQAAAQELQQIAPDGTPAYIKIRGLDSLRSALRAMIQQDVVSVDRVRFERLFG